ncbi:MAG: hypothetical protein RL699_1664 [Bacteroidota bacterium]|jgi:hypothetical protein
MQKPSVWRAFCFNSIHKKNLQFAGFDLVCFYALTFLVL